MPALHYKYVYQNFKQSNLYRSYNPVVPVYLQGRSKATILHCLHRQATSNKMTPSMIKNNCNGNFEVQGKNKTHLVSFGVLTDDPACTCKDWITYKIPCKHFFAVFHLYSEWGWDKLPEKYLQSPYLNLDGKAISDYIQTSPQENTIELEDSSMELKNPSPLSNDVSLPTVVIER